MDKDQDATHTVNDENNDDGVCFETYDYGICFICKANCNSGSQSCGSCARGGYARFYDTRK